METEKRGIDLRNLNKATWQTHRFDVIAKSITERVDPNNTDLEVYVGLEHIDAEDLHIRRKGTPADVSGQKIKCYPGDVIFGKRRAYQRKAAIADFEGICSAHAFVLRAKPKVIDPRLFPFFLHSDQFMHRAVDISVGGLSPTINWGQLKEQEFLLPPKEEQARLAELLWAMDDVIEKEEGILEKNLNLRQSQLKETYYFIPSDKKTEKVSIEKLIVLSSGKTRPNDLKDLSTGDYIYPVYGGNGVIGYSKDYLIDYNTIVIGRVGEYCGVVHDSIGKVWISDNALYVKEYLAKIDQYYLSRYLEYIDLNKQQNKSSHPLITQTKVYTNCIYIYSDEITWKKNFKLKSIEEAIFNIESKLSYSKKLQKSLINQIF